MRECGRAIAILLRVSGFIRRRHARHPPGALALLSARAHSEPWQQLRAAQQDRRITRMLQQVQARLESQRRAVHAAIALRRLVILERNTRMARMAAQYRLRARTVFPTPPAFFESRRAFLRT